MDGWEVSVLRLNISVSTRGRMLFTVGRIWSLTVLMRSGAVIGGTSPPFSIIVVEEPKCSAMLAPESRLCEISALVP